MFASLSLRAKRGEEGEDTPGVSPWSFMATLKLVYNKTMKPILLILVVVVIVAGGFWFIKKGEETKIPTPVTNFTECVEAGNPVMESYPRQCRTEDGQTFIEDIGNALEKVDLIRLTSPLPNEVVKSPLKITGEARGFWFFEASFPVFLVNWDGLIIAEGIATAKDDWMTEDFVPFEATLEFEIPKYKNNGALILKKDNPSGLPEHDDALEVPILFSSPNP